jgi:hypothetical protein
VLQVGTELDLLQVDRVCGKFQYLKNNFAKNLRPNRRFGFGLFVTFVRKSPFFRRK